MPEEKTSQDLEEIKKQLEDCQKLKEEYLSSWQRERADFLNYKKEEMERIGGILEYAGAEIILKILPILDNFEISEKKLSDELKQNESVKGILQIKNQILTFLKNLGVEPIDCLGKKFDPNFMEAVEDVPAETLTKAGVEVKESGIIIEEIQKGYKIQDKLLRVTKVKISK